MESNVGIIDAVRTLRLAAVAFSPNGWTRDMCLTLSACKKILLRVSPTDPNHPFHSGTDPGDRTRRKRFGKGRANKTDDGDFFWPRIGSEYQASIPASESPTESLSAHNNEKHRLLWKPNGKIDSKPSRHSMVSTGRMLRNGRHHKKIDIRVTEATEKLEHETKLHLESQGRTKVEIEEVIVHLGAMNIGTKLVSKWSETDIQGTCVCVL